MKLQIRSQLFMLAGVIAVLILVLSVSARFGMNHASDTLGEILAANHALQVHEEADMMHDALRGDVLSAMLAQSSSDWDTVHRNIQEHAKHFRELVDENDKNATDPEIRSALSDVKDSVSRYITSAENMIAATETDRKKADVMMPAFVAAFEDLEGKMEEVSHRIEAAAAGAEKRMTGSLSNSKMLNLILLAAAIAIAVLTTRALVKSVSSGLDDLKHTVTQLADGKLGSSVDDSRHDEFGEVLRLLRAMDTRFCEIVGSVRTTSESVGTAAREVSQGNDDLSQRTQQQAASLQETATSMEQMEATVKQNADNARQASQLAIGARGQADQGGAVVQRAIGAMNEINSSSRKIADIIGVIDEIAFQTNLLALNAAVEAARAGEQGRGFAVVATEVRNLAQRSATAAKEIKGLINESVEKVKVGAELVNVSGKTINDIMDSVRKVTDIVAEIAAASEEQASSIQQVNRAVSQMDATTQQNAALVEQAAAASKSMEHQTQQLTSRVSFFRIGGSTAQMTSLPHNINKASDSRASRDDLPLAKAS
jgi:methyl-accepting chemotaxis protein